MLTNRAKKKHFKKVLKEMAYNSKTKKDLNEVIVKLDNLEANSFHLTC